MVRAPGTTAKKGLLPFILITIALPTLTSAIGIDGGQIFQIIAASTLHLDARAIGIAFGLSVVSVPFQLLAVRMPLWRARITLFAYLGVTAAQCVVLALLVVTHTAGTSVAFVALAVAVLAEISLSVLFAPAWQPLLSFALTSGIRQTINSRVAAVGRGIAVVAVTVFGAATQSGQALLLFGIAGVALAVGVSTRYLHVPDRGRDTSAVSDQNDRSGAPPLSGSIWRVILVTGAVAAVSGWPLILVYAQKVLWPTGNLGLLGAVQMGGALVAALLWRTTAASLRGRALQAGVVLLLATVALTTVRVPISGTAATVLVVAALAVAGASRMTLGLALLELAHRYVDDRTSVKGMTILDVVASTSLQIGLLVAGFLVSFSQGDAGWVLDPYRVYLLAGGVAVAVGLTQLPSH